MNCWKNKVVLCGVTWGCRCGIPQIPIQIVDVEDVLILDPNRSFFLIWIIWVFWIKLKYYNLISFHFWLCPYNTHTYRRCGEPRGVSWLGKRLIRSKCSTDLTQPPSFTVITQISLSSKYREWFRGNTVWVWKTSIWWLSDPGAMRVLMDFFG